MKPLPSLTCVPVGLDCRACVGGGSGLAFPPGDLPCVCPGNHMALLSPLLLHSTHEVR